MFLLSEWERDGRPLCSKKLGDYTWVNFQTFISRVEILNPDYVKNFNNRIPAGLFGVAKSSLKEYSLFENYLSILNKNYKSNPTIFNYGIDEILLVVLFQEEFESISASSSNEKQGPFFFTVTQILIKNWFLIF